MPIHSAYFDVNSLKNNFHKSTHPILASLNVQSLLSKHTDLSSFLHDANISQVPIDILALQETWTVSHTQAAHIPGYTFMHNDRKLMRGGGVGFYVKDHLNFSVSKNFSSFIPKIFECLSIELTINNKKIIISSIYRSPSSNQADVQTFLENLDALLFNLTSQNITAYICLDSNINLLKPSQHQPQQQYLSIIHENNFIQCIEKATRIIGNSSSLIDHILTNSRANSLKSGVLISDISDHFMTFLEMPFTKPPKKQNVDYSRNFSKQNLENFRNDLGKLKWTEVMSSRDIETSYDSFWDPFKTLYELNFPLRKSKFNKNYHAINGYMTKGLLISRGTKLQLHKKQLKDPSKENVEGYRNYRNLFNKLIRASKKHYFDINFEKAKKNPKKTWGLIKEAIGTNTGNAKINKISVDGNVIENSQEIANEFNKFFTSAGKKISDDIIPTDRLPESYLPNNCEHNLEFSPVSQAEVVNIIRNFQPKSSFDIEGISMKLMKYVALEISHPLAHIFSLSLDQGIFPQKLKTSRIIPLHKSGSTELCDNYRPISLLSSISKILEKIVSIKLVNHLDFNKLISPRQFGFQKNKNTEQNLLNVINFISNELNKGNFCIGIFLDLKKAFDLCNHEILFKKLKNKGVVGKELEWFKSYFSGRRQAVDINGKISYELELDMSVIQGSILGPTLFLIYVDDLPQSSILETFLFADDTQGLIAGKNLNELIDTVNLELSKWALWFRCNKMMVNTSKTKYIIFHTKGKKVNMNGKDIFFNQGQQDSILERIHSNHSDKSSRSYKLLGILLDEHLSFENHISLLKSKLSKALFFINRAKHFVPKKTLTTLYHSLFHSHLLYCPIIVSCANKSALDKITIMQKKAIRTITNSKASAHTDPLFSELKILQYNKIIYQSQMLFFHSIHYDYAPRIFANTWIKNSQRVHDHDYNLRNAEDYFVPHPKLAFFKKFPLYTLPKIWNEAGTLTFYNNRTTFKIALSDHLLNGEENNIINNELPPPTLPPPPPPLPAPTQHLNHLIFYSKNPITYSTVQQNNFILFSN